MHGLEQEVASYAHFIISALEDVTPYYWEVPESFHVPAVFFPTPEIETHGDTLSSYEMAYTWFVKLFHKTDGEAQNLALTALTAIKRARNCIPLKNEDGSDAGHCFRVLDPSIKQVERGAWQLQLRWESPRYYDDEAEFDGDSVERAVKATSLAFTLNGISDAIIIEE